jgi:Amt family ammonium transporter
MPDSPFAEKPSPFRPVVVIAMILLMSAVVFAQTLEGAKAAPKIPGGKVDSGDTAWVMISTGLVMLMTPGLAFFYGGLVRRKNVLSILMQCMMILCLVSVEWVLLGYTMAFSPGGRFVGSLSWFGLSGVGAQPCGLYAKTIPHTVFVMFQMMFAVITPALIIGAFAERMRFGPFCLFTLLWAVLVYNPVCHWVWGDGGFLKTVGVLDFAGGTVVHINAGVASLAAALFLGKRKGYPHKISPPHNLPFAVLGAGLLWFGWFGFNAGSALGANGLAGSALLNTHVAAAVAGLAWAMLDWLKYGRPTMLGMITGAVAGLATVTQAAGFVTPAGAIWIGLLGGGVCWVSVTLAKAKFGYDDSLDAFGVHGVGGMVGALATGLFASKIINPDGANGLFYGNPAQFLTQAKAVGIVMVYSFVASLVLFKLVDMVAPLRVTEMDERIGLDLTLHREAGYTVID